MLFIKVGVSLLTGSLQRPEEEAEECSDSVEPSWSVFDIAGSSGKGQKASLLVLTLRQIYCVPSPATQWTLS